MDEINDNILNFDCLDYNEQRLYIANKLLSYNLNDITHRLFFKKIYVILKRLPEILKEFNDEIGTNAEIFINLWCDLKGKTYLFDNKGYIKLKYVKLTKVNYIVKVPTKFESTIRLHINIKHV